LTFSPARSTDPPARWIHRTAPPGATRWRRRTAARAPTPWPSTPGNLLPSLGNVSSRKRSSPSRRSNSSPAKGRRTSGCARHELASHRLPPIAAQCLETGGLMRGRSLGTAFHSQAAPVHPSPPAKPPPAAAVLAPCDSSLPEPNKRGACRPSSIAAPQVHSPILRICGHDSRGLVVTTSAFRNCETPPRQPRGENKRRPFGLSVCRLSKRPKKVAERLRLRKLG